MTRPAWDSYLLLPRSEVAACLVRAGWQPYPDLVDVAMKAATRVLLDRRRGVPTKETRAEVVHLPQYGLAGMRWRGERTCTVGDVVDSCGLGGML